MNNSYISVLCKALLGKSETKPLTEFRASEEMQRYGICNRVQKDESI